MSRRKKVLVLMGGFSSERDVSLVSGEIVRDALVALDCYDVETVDVSREVDVQIRASFGGDGPDAVFNALHGLFGEDGTVQGMLAMMGLPYTHSGVLASSLCMDKALTKDVLAAAGLPVPEGRIVTSQDAVPSDHLMALPYVLKPVAEGSTFGVVIYRSGTNEYPTAALLNDPVYNGRAMIEAYIPGRELTVAVKGDEPLAVTEIITDFYDYEAKYSGNAAPHVVPAEIPEEISAACLKMATKAVQTLGCSGLSRVDFRWDEAQGLNGLFILEVNTQPGMTPTSLSAEQAAFRGVSFGELVQWMVEDALCRR
ncbi:MAG: D-alanine--D-alanine ligase [Pseudomonadota bacterium]